MEAFAPDGARYSAPVGGSGPGFEGLFESVPDALVATDTEGRIQHMNGLTVFTLTLPEDRGHSTPGVEYA